MTLRLVIANNREYCAALDYAFRGPELARWRNEDLILAEQAIFWGGEDKLVVTPHRVDPRFVADVKSAMEYRNLCVVSPASTTQSICKDIQSDANLWQTLTKTLQESESVEIIAWGATPQLYTLLERLIELGIPVSAPELPSNQNADLAQKLDSKSGFREIASKLAQAYPEVRIPVGYVCSTDDELASAAVELMRASDSILLKADKGVGGWGNMKLDRQSYVSAAPSLFNTLTRNSGIWRTGSIVAEEYLDVMDSPTVDALITPDGQVQMLICGRQVLGTHLDYLGLEVGPHTYSPEVMARIRKIVSIIGQELAQLGYRGWFDVDMVRTTDDAIYCVEINTRRTGVTYIWEILQRIDVGQSMIAYASNQTIDPKLADYGKIRARIGPAEPGPSGVMLTTASSSLLANPSITYFAWSLSEEGLNRQLARLVAATTLQD